MNKFKVLIAESTPSVRQFIRYTLEDHFLNLEFEVATNGKNVQKRLESTHYDLILYDKDMPLLDGYELLKWLRSHEKLKNIPLIMISGDRDEKSLKTAIQLGANAYLIKPLLMDPLVDKVKEVFSEFEKNKYDRRKHDRYKAYGDISLEFNSRSCSGKLQNISMGGLLSAFEINETLPHILEKVGVNIALENKRNVKGIEGHVMRIQVFNSFAGSKNIQIAVEFVNDLDPEKKKELFELVSFLKQ